MGRKSGYAKFETFPIWNLPLNHPVNLAYEAATADLADVNMIDPFHLEAYGSLAVNYNRDVEVFPVVEAMFKKIYGESPYKSPTDMGVNMVGNCIFDDAAVSDASRQEIIRRYYAALCEQKENATSSGTVGKLELIMNQANVTVNDRPAVAAANGKAELTGGPAAAIELPDGRIVTGKTSNLLGASSAALLNAAKAVAGLPEDLLMIAPSIIEPIQELKTGILKGHNPRLHSDETLIALSMSANSNPLAKKALDAIELLKNCEAHSTVILSQVDSDVYRKIGMNLTCEPRYQTKKLYHGKS
jgi:uncharacterized protein (UPF0371 family)